MSEPNSPDIVEGNNQPEDLIVRAKELLGKDFLGQEAVIKLQDRLKQMGANIQFPVNELPKMPYTLKDLELAKQEGEILILRAGSKIENGTIEPITLASFRELFDADPAQKLFFVERPSTFRSDGDTNEDIDLQRRILEDEFARAPDQIALQWALVKKSLLPGSENTTESAKEEIVRGHVEALKQKGASNTSVRRRTAMEAVWDDVLYYVNTEEYFTPAGKLDVTSSRMGGGQPVTVGFTPKDSTSSYVDYPPEPAIIIDPTLPDTASARMGTCVQR